MEARTRSSEAKSGRAQAHVPLPRLCAIARSSLVYCVSESVRGSLDQRRDLAVAQARPSPDLSYERCQVICGSVVLDFGVRGWVASMCSRWAVLFGGCRRVVGVSGRGLGFGRCVGGGAVNVCVVADVLGAARCALL